MTTLFNSVGTGLTTQTDWSTLPNSHRLPLRRLALASSRYDRCCRSVWARILDTSRSLSTRAGNLVLAAVVVSGLFFTTMAGLLGLNAPMAAEAAVLQVTEKDANPVVIVPTRGRVVDEHGRPVTGATIDIFRSRNIPYQFQVHEHLKLGTVKVNEKGEFEFTVPPAEDSPSDPKWSRWQPATFIANAPGYAPNWCIVENDDDKLTIRLSNSVPLLGRLVNADGIPAAGVEVQVTSMANTISDEVKQWLNAKESTAPPTGATVQKGSKRLRLCTPRYLQKSPLTRPATLKSQE